MEEFLSRPPRGSSENRFLTAASVQSAADVGARCKIPFLRDLFSQPKEEGHSVPTPRLEKILLAIESFNFATLPYDDLFLVWDVSPPAVS